MNYKLFKQFLFLFHRFSYGILNYKEDETIFWNTYNNFWNVLRISFPVPLVSNSFNYTLCEKNQWLDFKHFNSLWFGFVVSAKLLIPDT